MNKKELKDILRILDNLIGVLKEYKYLKVFNRGLCYSIVNNFDIISGNGKLPVTTKISEMETATSITSLVIKTNKDLCLSEGGYIVENELQYSMHAREIYTIDNWYDLRINALEILKEYLINSENVSIQMLTL